MGEAHPCMEEEDRWIWSIDSSGIFSVKAILRAVYANQNQVFPCTLAWNNKIPPRVQVFTWATAKGKISVKCNLKDKVLLPSGTSVVCFQYGLEEESDNHLMCCFRSSFGLSF